MKILPSYHVVIYTRINKHIYVYINVYIYIYIYYIRTSASCTWKWSKIFKQLDISSMASTCCRPPRRERDSITHQRWSRPWQPSEGDHVLVTALAPKDFWKKSQLMHSKSHCSHSQGPYSHIYHISSLSWFLHWQLRFPQVLPYLATKLRCLVSREALPSNCLQSPRSRWDRQRSGRSTLSTMILKQFISFDSLEMKKSSGFKPFPSALSWNSSGWANMKASEGKVCLPKEKDAATSSLVPSLQEVIAHTVQNILSRQNCGKNILPCRACFQLPLHKIRLNIIKALRSSGVGFLLFLLWYFWNGRICNGRCVPKYGGYWSSKQEIEENK